MCCSRGLALVTQLKPEPEKNKNMVSAPVFGGEIFHKLVVWFCKYLLLGGVGPGHSAEARADWTAASIHSSAHSNVGNPMDTVFKNHPFGVYPRYTETALIQHICWIVGID